MKGLVLKDIFVITKQSKMLLFVLVIFAFSAAADETMIPFVIFYASLLPVTALAYDEHAKWNTLAKMMPYSPFEVVFSKYVLGYIMVALAGAICLIAQTMISAVKNSSVGAESSFLLLFYMAVALLIQTVDFPLMFRFGVEKGRLWFMLLTVATIIVTVAAGTNLFDRSADAELSTWVVPASAVILAVFANIVSIFISIKFYCRGK